MLEKRFKASSVILNSTTLWIVGGSDGPNRLATTEFITINQPSIKVCSKKQSFEIYEK